MPVQHPCSFVARIAVVTAILVLVGLTLSVPVHAQSLDPKDTVLPDTARLDTQRRDPDVASTAPEVTATRDDASTDSTLLREYRMTKSPTAAVLYSIVPGGGQLYNEQFLKAAVFFGAGAYFASQAVYYHQRFTTLAAEVDAIPVDSVSQREQPRALREFYRDNRDLNVAYFIGIQILSMIDAYVGAHLFDFDVSGGQFESKARISVDPWNQRLGVSLGF